MGRQVFSNYASTTLAAPISSSTATALSVASGALFPSSLTNGNWFIVTLQRIVSGLVTAQEIVKVTAVAGVNWTIARAQENTAGLTWSIGDTVAELFTAGGMANLVQAGDIVGLCPVLPSVAALRLTTPQTSGAVFYQLLGYTTIGDGGVSWYYYNAADSTTADNGSTVIVSADGSRWYIAGSLK